MTRRADAQSANERIVSKTLWLSLILFAFIHPTALIGVLWTISTVTTPQTLEGATPAAWVVGAIGCLVLAVWPARPSVFLRTRVVGFVFFEALFLGGLVTYCESVLPGVALQLSFAAFSAVIGALAVLSTERIRSTPLFVRTSLVAAAGYLVFVFHNLGFSSMDLPLQTAWGAGSNIVFGIPLGLLLGLLLVPLTSYALVRRVARASVAAIGYVEPAYPWRAALGIVTTIIWPWEETPPELLARGLVSSG